jgi:hypothetical protein
MTTMLLYREGESSSRPVEMEQHHYQHDVDNFNENYSGAVILKLSYGGP